MYRYINFIALIAMSSLDTDGLFKFWQRQIICTQKNIGVRSSPNECIYHDNSTKRTVNTVLSVKNTITHINVYEHFPTNTKYIAWHLWNLLFYSKQIVFDPLFSQFKMDFKCFECKCEFADVKNIFYHMKTVHLHKNGSTQLFCVANNDCTKSYLSFDSLRNHLKQCVKVRKSVNENSF